MLIGFVLIRSNHSYCPADLTLKVEQNGSFVEIRPLYITGYINDSETEFLEAGITSCKMHLRIARTTSCGQLREVAITNMLDTSAMLEAYSSIAALTEEERSSLGRSVEDLQQELRLLRPDLLDRNRSLRFDH